MCDYCSWIEKILRPKVEDLPTICTNILNEETEEQNLTKIPIKYEPTILVHGTADSASSGEEIKETLEKIVKAAVETYKELAKGCEAVDAVEMAIRGLELKESKPDGEAIESFSKDDNSIVIRDAAIMDSDSNAGFVAATTDTLHPITVAKKVMRDCDHLLILENGIRYLEISSNVPAPEDDSNQVLPTPPNSRNSNENFNYTTGDKNVDHSSKPKGRRIYGAVVRDRGGRLACGISTTDDREESIEKSSMTASGSVLGCGIFSNAQFCASVSSEDRAVYLYAPARKIVERLQRERDVKGDSNAEVQIEDLLNDELTNFFKDTGQSCVGTAALTIEGKPEVAFTSTYFPWASCNNGIINSGCVRGEVFEKEVGELDMPLDCRCD